MGVTQSQVGAMEESKIAGRELALATPWIAEEYSREENYTNLDGLTSILMQRGILNHGCSFSTARNIVYHALETLIPDKLVFSAIGLRHRKDATKALNDRLHEEKRGIVFQSEQERKDASSLGGKIAYSSKKGMWALEGEEKEKAMRKGIISRGQIPYNGVKVNLCGIEMSEIEYTAVLKESKIYDYGGGWNEITEKVNFYFKKSRNSEQLQSAYRNYLIRQRKSQEKTQETGN